MVAVAALPPLLLVVIAAACLLAAMAFGFLIAKPLAMALGQIPVIGGQIADALLGAAQTVQSWAEDAFEGAVSAFQDVVDLITGMIQAWIDSVTDNLVWVVNQAVVLLRSVGSVWDYLQARVKDLTDGIAAVAKDAAKGIARAAAVAADLAGALARVIPDLIAKAIAATRDWALGKLQDAQRALQAIVAAVESAVLAKLGLERAARIAADNELADATQRWLNDLARELGADVNTLGRELGQAIDGLELDLSGLRELIGPIAAGTVVGLITKVATDVTTMYRECVQPGCNYLGPQLDSLNGIGNAVTLGAVVAWIAHAAQHPQAAAGDTLGQWDGAIREALGVFSAATGVHV